MPRKHTRIVQFPFAASLQGALLDFYEEERRNKELHITLKVRAFERTPSSELFEHNGILHERIQGNYVPAQLHFTGIAGLKSSDLFTNIPALPPNDPNRRINDLLSWQQPGRQDIFYLFFMQAPKMDNLMFFARHVTYECLARESTSVTLERDWSPPPSMPERLVPQPSHLHRRFGGDPITIKVNETVVHHKLFIGGLEIQPKQRPHVDAVLNLGEETSRWIEEQELHPNDRAINKGEGAHGMTVLEMCEEANWVIERLKNNQRVLVHCVAGMNRSATICCAVLILLEGLSAEEALQRVREHHPWARPDSHHWLALRWLEINKKE